MSHPKSIEGHQAAGTYRRDKHAKSEVSGEVLRGFASTTICLIKVKAPPVPGRPNTLDLMKGGALKSEPPTS